MCASPTTTVRPSTQNFVSIVSLCRVATPFHMCEKRQWYTRSVSFDGTSNAPTKSVIAPVFGMMTCCVNASPTYALPRLRHCACSCESPRQLRLRARPYNFDRADTFPSPRAKAKRDCAGCRNPIRPSRHIFPLSGPKPPEISMSNSVSNCLRNFTSSTPEEL